MANVRVETDARGIRTLTIDREPQRNALDLREVLAHQTLDDRRRHFDGVARVIRAMHELGVPVIARVQGFALAGGCGLAFAADFTSAAEEALRLGLATRVVPDARLDADVDALPQGSHRSRPRRCASARKPSTRCPRWSTAPRSTICAR